jgi:hypothetical protein
MLHWNNILFLRLPKYPNRCFTFFVSRFPDRFEKPRDICSDETREKAETEIFKEKKVRLISRSERDN